MSSVVQSSVDPATKTMRGTEKPPTAKTFRIRQKKTPQQRL